MLWFLRPNFDGSLWLVPIFRASITGGVMRRQLDTRGGVCEIGQVVVTNKSSKFMNNSLWHFKNALAASFVAVALIPSASAEVKTFVVDPSQSTLVLSGTVYSIPMREQDMGSLTTSYTGSVLADVATDSITFVGGSAIAANNSGSWQPLTNGVSGNAPANYGAFGSANLLGGGNVALRQLLFDLKSAAISSSAGLFAADGLEFSFPDNAVSSADYYFNGGTGLHAGSQRLTGTFTNNATNNATVNTVNGEIVLTIPVDFTLAINGSFFANLRFQGQLVARAIDSNALRLPQPIITPGHLEFDIPTESGKTYTILGSGDLIAFPEIVDQFAGNGSTVPVDITMQSTGQKFFLLKVE